jgi:hypothetical protein
MAQTPHATDVPVAVVLARLRARRRPAEERCAAARRHLGLRRRTSRRRRLRCAARGTATLSGARTLGFADLFFYAASVALSIRWISVAAASGPASLPLWVVAVLLRVAVQRRDLEARDRS